jgi:hypothetical protein
VASQYSTAAAAANEQSLHDAHEKSGPFWNTIDAEQLPDGSVVMHVANVSPAGHAPVETHVLVGPASPDVASGQVPVTVHGTLASKLVPPSKPWALPPQSPAAAKL